MECLQGAIRCGVVVREFISHKSYIGILFFWKVNIDMENLPYAELTNIVVVSQWCQPQSHNAASPKLWWFHWAKFGFLASSAWFFYVLFAVGLIFIHAFLFIFSETSVQANVWDSNH